MVYVDVKVDHNDVNQSDVKMNYIAFKHAGYIMISYKVNRTITIVIKITIIL